MKRLIPLLAALVLTACSEESPPPRSSPFEQERQLRVVAEERTAQAERRAAENQVSRDRWQTFAMLV